MLWSASYRPVSKNTESISTLTSGGSRSLWVTCTLLQEGLRLWLCNFKTPRQDSSLQESRGVSEPYPFPRHHAHCPVFCSPPIPFAWGLAPYSTFLKDQTLRAGWAHKRETNKTPGRQRHGFERQVWSHAAWAGMPIPFLAGSVNQAKATNFTEPLCQDTLSNPSC